MEIIYHPEGLHCPICGCGQIFYWQEFENWNSIPDEDKDITCAACFYHGDLIEVEVPDFGIG